MDLYDAIVDFISVFPEGNPMIIKNKISNQSDKMLVVKFQELVSISNDDNYILINITKLDNCYNNMYFAILELIKNEIMYRTNKSFTITPATLSIHALEFVPKVYKSEYQVHKLSSNSIKHIKNMLNNPYMIKYKKLITIDNILMNHEIKPMYSREIMIQLIKSSNDFSYDDSTNAVRFK